MEHRRRCLRQPQQPQRCAFNPPAAAQDSHLREGHASAGPDRLPPAQRRVGYRRAGIAARRDGRGSSLSHEPQWRSMANAW